NRAGSLRETLESLAEADRGNLSVEVVVIDNNSNDHTKDVLESFVDRLPVRYLFEPKQGNGKSDPLNCALDAGGFGDIVAFLDDDMTVEKGWFLGVKSICDRKPEHDLFSGRSYVIWPNSEVPEWARSQQILQWGMSVMESIRKDHEIERGFWPSGNHFWVRKRVFNGGRRFHNLWSEAYFTLQL
ncbi:MAG: glycosyltransferase family 2 protein, partial [Candidatus Omnitrophica bacterium]|nr:glycosyltransferase family 2 protein [Candidatus Omnitrophota bacterium]